MAQNLEVQTLVLLYTWLQTIPMRADGYGLRKQQDHIICKNDKIKTSTVEQAHYNPSCAFLSLMNIINNFGQLTENIVSSVTVMK